MTRIRPVLVALVASVIVAAGCSGGDVIEAADPTTTPPAATDTEPTNDSADTRPTSSTTEPVELTASFRGVTEDAIRVGVVAVDFDRLAAIGVDFNSGDAAAVYAAALEGINDRGGVHGRRLEFTVERYLPIGGTEADATCARLTEDVEVFVVVGAVRLDDVLCYTGLAETAVIAVTQQNQARLDASRAPYATVRVRIDRRTTEFVSTLMEAGVFDGETVGVLGSAEADQALFEDTVAALRAVGVEPVEGLAPNTNGDVLAARRHIEVVLERFRTEGVTLTVHASPVAVGIGTAEAVGYETTWVQIPPLGANALDSEGIDLDYVDGMLTLMPTALGTVEQEALADDPAVAACVATVEAHSDLTVDFEIGAEDGILAHALNGCGMATILELGLAGAGPVLTNESFGAALERIGRFEMAGFPPAELGPGDTDAAGAGRLVAFSAEHAAYEFVD